MFLSGIQFDRLAGFPPKARGNDIGVHQNGNRPNASNYSLQISHIGRVSIRDLRGRIWKSALQLRKVS
jgi:hypothetical protein